MPDATPISPGEAINHAAGLISAYHDGRPVTTSRNWKLPDTERAKTLKLCKRIGKAPSDLEEHLETVAADHGCDTQRIPLQGDPSRRRMIAKTKIVPKCGRALDRDARDALHADLMSNVDGRHFRAKDFDIRTGRDNSDAGVVERAACDTEPIVNAHAWSAYQEAGSG